MSVDDRLRSAFGETDESWDRRADEALREVGRRHARGVLLRRAAAGGALAAAVAVGAVLVVNDGRGGRAAPDPVGPPASPTQLNDPQRPSSKTVLEGRWRTPLLDEGDLRAALEESGSGQYADRVLGELQPVPGRLVWVVTYETAQLRVVSGRESTVLDEVSLAVDGDQVTVSPRFANGANVHEFTVTDDELRLRFISTTEPDSHGVPAEVWARLLYDSFPFTRR